MKDKKDQAKTSFVDMSAYFELMDECLDPEAEKQSSIPGSEAVTSPSSNEPNVAQTRSKKRFPALLEQRSFQVVVGMLVINLVVLGMFGAGGTKGMSQTEATLQLQKTYGNDFERIEAVDNFFDKTDGLTTARDRRFVTAVDDLNQGLLSPWDNGSDYVDSEEFDPDYFLFHDAELVYREPGR